MKEKSFITWAPGRLYDYTFIAAFDTRRIFSRPFQGWKVVVLLQDQLDREEVCRVNLHLK